MSDADTLRSLAATATAAADALDQRARDQATIAGLEHTRDAQAADLARLTALVAELRAQIPPKPATLWGANVWRFDAETFPQALARGERALGHFDVLRYFAAAPTWNTGTGDRPLHISFKWPPRDVAAGKYDAAFKAWCAAAPARPTWWTFWHEPEDNIAKGEFTAADYRAAWARLAPIAKASGKDLRATLTLMAWTLEPDSNRKWRDYYAGDAHVDVLAWDAYHKMSGQTDPAKVYARCRAVAVETGKPWAVAETGVSKVWVPNPAERVRLLTGMARDLATVEPRPVFVTYFDAHNPAENPAWVWDISREPAASTAWTEGRRPA